MENYQEYVSKNNIFNYYESLIEDLYSPQLLIYLNRWPGEKIYVEKKSVNQSLVVINLLSLNCTIFCKPILCYLAFVSNNVVYKVQ